jgi:predicted DNA-binding transcriptional regulator AlpA
MKSVQNLQQVWSSRLPPTHSIATKEGQCNELVTASEAAQVLGVGLRKFNQLRGEVWMPKPVMLGSRCLRWIRSELMGAISANAPRTDKFDEPQHLQLARTTSRTK